MKTLIISAVLALAALVYFVATAAPGSSVKDAAKENRNAISEAQALWD